MDAAEATVQDPTRDAAHDAAAAALAGLLGALDALLGVAVDRLARLIGPASLLDPWRGMHLSEDDVKQVLAQVAPRRLGSDAVSAALAQCARRVPSMAKLADDLALADTDLAVLAIVLAPDLDLRYERIYAYLQDDISRRRPGADLIANLLASSPAQRLALARRLHADAPLRRFGVLVPARGAAELPDPARPWEVDAGWRHWIEGRDELDPALRACVDHVVLPPERGLPPDPAAWRRVQALLAKGDGPWRVVLCGAHGTGKFQFSVALAGALGLQLLRMDLRRAGGDSAELLTRAQRAALRQEALLFVHGTSVCAQEPSAQRALSHALADAHAPMLLACVEPLPWLHGRRLLTLRLDYPAAPQRASLWNAALARHGLTAPADAVGQIASTFALSAPQIEQAAQDLSLSTGPAVQTQATLSAAARALCGDELARLAQRIRPEASFASLVTSAEATAQLHEICQRMRTRAKVRDTWMRGSLHARTGGVAALFAGPSGTGKTLAAEVIAHALGFDLFRIDLSTVVSKYIGETEKNLDRVFSAALRANAVLLFDEADALFGKRSEVKDAHDRYANIEVAYLLQKLEQFDGLAILATNLKQNLDDAFTRRLTFCVNFPFPESAERLKLWETLWPPNAPRHPDVDLAALAREHRLSGGNIRNVILAALHQAMAEGCDGVARVHLMNGVRREFQKLGRSLAPAVPAKEAA